VTRAGFACIMLMLTHHAPLTISSVLGFPESRLGYYELVQYSLEYCAQLLPRSDTGDWGGAARPHNVDASPASKGR
jgi:hypothetical protein